MSLDVYLMGPTVRIRRPCPECGHKRTEKHREELFTSNITHNLGRMAGKAGIYKHLWRPDELGITRAKKLIKPLREGLSRMRKNPSYFKQFEPDNKWGTYDNFIPWLEEYISACEKYPNATVRVSR